MLNEKKRIQLVLCPKINKIFADKQTVKSMCSHNEVKHIILYYYIRNVPTACSQTGVRLTFLKK